jgi:tRNA pseudouridine55 synthase
MPRKPKTNLSGWINLNKPVGITSNDALHLLKKKLGFPKIGHAGTLDPLASGVLPIALGEATKLISYMVDDEKSYQFTVTWGEQRSTDDSEGVAMKTSDLRPTEEQIRAILPQFIGTIQQTPPQFSAIKIDGQRAYDLARAGEDVDIKPRAVEIYDLQLLSVTPDSATFLSFCGKGTYVRSLARDMGLVLGCFGYISALSRQSVGPFTLDQAIPLDFFKENDDNSTLTKSVLAVETVLDDIPVLAMEDQEASRVRNGQKLTFVARPQVQRLIQAGMDVRNQDGYLALATWKGQALAVLEVQGVEIQPIRVFNL